MPQRVAIAWSLLLVLLLLLGVLLIVVAFGVVRHLRRQRHRRDASRAASRPPSGDRDFDPDDADLPRPPYGRSSPIDPGEE